MSDYHYDPATFAPAPAPNAVTNDPEPIGRKYRLDKSDSVQVPGSVSGSGGSVRVHRIVALVDMPAIGVYTGDKGGFVESESNLSHDGRCWIFDEAIVRQNAGVFDDATMHDHAMLLNSATLLGHASMRGKALAFDNASIYEHARLSGNAIASGDALIYGYATVRDNARITDDAEIGGDAILCGDAALCGSEVMLSGVRGV